MHTDTEITDALETLLRAGPMAVPEAVATARAEDVAEVLNRLEPPAAATLVAAMPFDFAVKVLEHPEFERRSGVFRHLDAGAAARLLEAMSPDEQADLFREL